MHSGVDTGTHLFLVRLWVEPREVVGEPVRVPGEVKQLATGRTRAFTSGAELLGFLDDCLDEAGVQPRTGFAS